MSQVLHLDFPQNPYALYLGKGILEEKLPAFLQQCPASGIFLVTNPVVEKIYGKLLRDILPKEKTHFCLLPEGEQNKNLLQLERLYNQLLEKKADRQALILAFGGGVVGDMAGFLAASFMRGVKLVQIPTTLLAQVDSSIGGKTAVNLPQAKNVVGAFKQPEAVFMELNFLQTLPLPELYAGMMELVKHAIIGDKALFHTLRQNQEKLLQGPEKDWDFWVDILYRSCKVKAKVVLEDEKEQGQRAFLNFGHTLGHLLESHTNYQTFLHGEAVGVGMLFAAHVSTKEAGLSLKEQEDMEKILLPFLPEKTAPPLEEETFTNLLLHDKKAREGKLLFVLVPTLGQVETQSISTKKLWQHYQSFHKKFSKLSPPPSFG